MHYAPDRISQRELIGQMTTLGVGSSSTFLAGDGTGYERLMGRWSRRLAPKFIDFAGIHQGDHVLDLGCGTGILGQALASSGDIKSITGIDYSSAYIEHARAHINDARLNFHVGDACALPFDAETFDHTASLLVLAFVAKPDEAVKEMLRVTKPGGIVAGCMWDTRGGMVFARMFWDTAAMFDPKANELRARAYTRPMTRPGDLVEAWKIAGFCEVVGEMITIRMDFANFEDYWQPIAGNDGPYATYLAGLPKAEYDGLKEAVSRAFLDGELDGERSLAATAWVVRGRVP
jgi:SAM-dependent methyltransferase